MTLIKQATPNRYAYNQTVTCYVRFRIDKTNTDPGTVTFRHKAPEATVYTDLVYNVDAAVVKEGTGQYLIHFLPTVAGTWEVRWEGTGGSFQLTADKNKFIVDEE